MENQDKIFEQFKDIARESESKDFPAMEKVWSRVEDKLDYKAARKSAGLWKVIAIAASVLLLVAVGYQLFESEKSPSGTITNELVITPDNIQKGTNQTPPEINQDNDQEVETNRTPITENQLNTVKKPVINSVIAVATGDFFIEDSEKPSVAETQIKPEAYRSQGFQTISGSVSDNSGLLPGANVVVMGTTRVTHTDIDGKYSIEAKEGEKLVFSFSGMKDIVATVGDENKIDAKLPGRNALLESSTMDAYGISEKGYASNAKKEKVAVFRAPAKTDIRKAEKSNDENPISTNIEFISNAPTLYIIDGKPATEAQFKQLKTDEIASMKLLSQSEATSLYGNKAVNGAMIVSKKAAKNANVTYSADDESFENAFESPVAAPLSTFKLSVETGSYTDIRNFINKGQKVPASAVRIEEMINYFEYRYPQPEGQNPVSINTEYSSCPWNSKHKLLKVGIQGKNAATQIVKDAKIQIEFNPTIVKGYRLIGYEKRTLRPEDFKTNSQAGGLVGGQTVTALYEVIPNGVDSQYFEEREGGEYNKVNTGTTFGGELANIKFRYENTGGKNAQMIKSVENKAELLQNSSNDFRFCAAVAWFGLKLRQSELIGNRSYAELLKLAKGSVTADSEGSRGEFVRLVEAVK
jgi:Ca-activated chloride channel family protein